MTEGYARIIILGTFLFAFICFILIMWFLLHLSSSQHLRRRIAGRPTHRNESGESNAHGTQAVTHVYGGASGIYEYDANQKPKITLV